LRPDVEAEGQTIQEGNKDIYDSKDPSELNEAMKRAIAEAEQVQKARGTMPAGLQRIVNEILRPKVPWKVLLKQSLRDGLGRTRTQSWKKLSRRHKDYPGNKRLTTPTVWVGIDTSGSISPKELAQFLSEVYGIIRQTRAHMVVIPWDAKMYEPTRVTSVSQVRNIEVKGGGGTNPTEFMQYTLRKMKPLDAVVILSDGYIGSSEDYVDLAKGIKTKSSVAIFVTTANDVNWPGWKLIKLE